MFSSVFAGGRFYGELGEAEGNRETSVWNAIYSIQKRLVIDS